MTRAALALGIFLVSCRPGGDARAGDRAYVEARYDAARVAYGADTATADGEEAGKLLAVAVRVGDAAQAVAAARRLVAADPERRREAIAWLLQGARASSDSLGSLAAYLEGAVALDSALPAATIGRGARRVLLARVGDQPALHVLLPGALAMADEPEATERLLLLVGAVAERGNDCERAMRAFAAVRRRAISPGATVEAEEGVVRCALRRGEGLLLAGDAFAAERAFAAAITGDSSSVGSRAGLIGIGRARTAMGDLAGAKSALAAAAAHGASIDTVSAAGPAVRDSAAPADTTPTED